MPGSNGNSSDAIQELHSKLSVEELIKRLKVQPKKTGLSFKETHHTLILSLLPWFTRIGREQANKNI